MHSAVKKTHQLTCIM